MEGRSFLQGGSQYCITFLYIETVKVKEEKLSSFKLGFCSSMDRPTPDFKQY
jgi:hypothetical protein